MVLALKRLVPIIAFLCFATPAWATLPTCTVTGQVLDAGGNPVANATVYFNSLRKQVVSGIAIQPVFISTTTDAGGNLNAIKIAQGLQGQFTINQGAPVPALIPLSGTALFGNIISGLIFSGGGFSLAPYTGAVQITANTGNGTDFITGLNVNGALNVQGYGAKGDGVADDTVALQTPADLCLGPNVVLPPGIYKHSVPISFNCPSGDFGGTSFSGINGGLPGQPSTSLTQNYDGPAVIMEAPTSNNITLAAPIVGSSGNAYSTSGTANGDIDLNLSDSSAMAWNGIAGFTVEGFFKITAYGANDQFFVLAQGGVAGHPEGGVFQVGLSPLTNGIASTESIVTFGIGIDNSHQIGAFAAIGGTTFILNSTTVVSLNTVYYVVEQYDGSNVKLWLTTPNAALGTPAATQAATGTVTMTPFEDVAMPGIRNGLHAFLNQEPTAPTSLMQSWRFSNASRAYGNATVAPNANLTSDGTTSMLLNFPSKCTSVGQANCSPDNMVEGFSGTLAENVYLPVHGVTEGNSVNAARIHDLFLNGGGIYSNWCVNCVWSRMEASVSREEGFDCNDNCFQTTWDHLFAVNSSIAFDFGESSHDVFMIRPFADDPTIGIFGGNWNAVMNVPQVTDRGDIVLPFFLSVFKGVINEDVLDVEGANTNYLTSAYIQNSWGPVIFNGGIMESLNNNAAVYYDPYFGISYAPHFIGTVFGVVGGSTPSDEVHQVTAIGAGATNSTPRQVIFDDTVVTTAYSDGNFVINPCLGTITLSGGSGTFTASCVHVDSACSCNATHACTVGSPSAGSVGITGTGTDAVQVACQ